jgi:hypothetical protein
MIDRSRIAGSHIIFLFIGITLLLSGCGGGQVKVPDYTIERDTFIAVLIDIHMADAYLAMKRSADDVFLKDEFYARILRKHQISKKEFDTTVQFYAHHPELYESLYDEILVLFSKQEAELAVQRGTTGQPGDTLSYLKMANETDTLQDIQGRKRFDETVDKARKSFAKKKIMPMAGDSLPVTIE